MAYFSCGKNEISATNFLNENQGGQQEVEEEEIVEQGGKI